MSSDRSLVMRRGIEPRKSLAIEVGPLDRPVLDKAEFDVRYLDFTDTKTLRDKYADDPGVGQVVDVDIIWDGGVPLVDVVGETRFDAVVASHVVEHIPDPVGWLAKLAAVLRPGGLVNLVIPDKRVTFDVNRQLTEVADLIDANIRGSSQPSYAQIFDFHTKAIMPADALLLWSGQVDYTGMVRPGDLAREALDACLSLREDGPHADVHCSVFTPTSFVDVIEGLAELGLVEFAIAELVPTKPNTVEFYVRLERLDPDASEDERRRVRQDGVTRARAAIAAAPAPAVRGQAESGSDAVHFVVSEKEQRLVELKRQVLLQARQGLSRLRHR
jgi:SAM-dependent methyltransferase